MDGIPLLQNRHSIGIILFLMDHSGCTRMDLYKGCGTHSKEFVDHLNELIDAGLVSSTGGQEFMNRRAVLDLTTKGREIAELLGRIKQITDKPEDLQRP